MVRLLTLCVIFIANIACGEVKHLPQNWQMNFMAPATPVMEKFVQFHNKLLIMCYGISGFVFILLFYACFKFSKKNNPTPNRTSHNTALEIIWTLIPFIIVCMMAIPSIKILYYSDQTPETEFTLKIVGRQWYWQYQYPDHDNIAFDSYMIQDQNLKKDQIRNLEVDNRIVLPVDTNIKLLLTSGDVLHSFAVPSFGIKIDCVPGRTNETWIRVTKPGIYYGQCSELCGVNHGFMPIAIEVVPKEEFKKWVATAKLKFSHINNNKFAKLN